eukprot:SAG31_NODE_12956_length_904_cov_1.551553_1_plen_175_part_10
MSRAQSVRFQAAEEFKKSIIAKHGVKNRSENLLGQKEEGGRARLRILSSHRRRHSIVFEWPGQRWLPENDTALADAAILWVAPCLLPALSYLILSYLILSYLILSYLILSYLILSCVCAGVSRYAMKKEAKRYASSLTSTAQANPSTSVQFHPTWCGARSGLCTCKAQRPPQSCG